MADKAIGDLTQATQITDDDLLVIEQGGTAKKVKIETLLEYITGNTESEATAGS